MDISRDNPLLFTLDKMADIAQALVEAGQLDQAGPILQYVARCVQHVYDKSHSLTAYAEVARALLLAGRAQEAEAVFAWILDAASQTTNESVKARTLSEVAQVMAAAHFGERAVQATKLILTDRDKHLPEVAASLAEAGDRTNFKHLLLPSAYYFDVALRMCGLLANLYPKQAGDIAEVVMAHKG